MGNICNLWSKEYVTGITSNGNTKIVSLNIFQRIARSIFGYYEETHLKKVLSTMSNTFTQENFSFAEGEALRVMNLFRKIYVMKGPFADGWDQTRTLLVREIIDTHGRTLKFCLQYDLSVENSWKVMAGIKDEDSDSFLYSTMSFCSDINDGELKEFGTMTTYVDGGVKDNSVKHNLGQFLIHILHHSHMLRGIEFKSKKFAKICGFQERRVSKDSLDTLPSPVELANLHPFSLDFILELASHRY